MSAALVQAHRRLAYRTRGNGHGRITRLMSPSDLGRLVKPFVFLDLFEADMSAMSMPLHPHSGIATVTVLTNGNMRFDDPDAGQGLIGYGGVEWMRAGGGVWHGKELSAGTSPYAQGFQLWIALPPDLENSPSESQYLEASAMAHVGPATVILGSHEGVASPVRAPDGINYLLVTLQPGESWTYRPPQGHSVAWLAVAQGEIEAGESFRAGDMVVFDRSEEPLRLTSSGDQEAKFVLGSAVPHPHDLHLGYYSVHTSAETLELGEKQIAELGTRLAEAGDRRTASGSTPVFR